MIAGRVVVDEQDVTELPPRRRDLATVCQSYTLYPHLTVANNIGSPMRVRGVDSKYRTASVRNGRVSWSWVRCFAAAQELTGGQRQQVGSRPRAGPRSQDLPAGRATLQLGYQTAHRDPGRLAALHRRPGSTFVDVTHDQVEAMTMATHIALLANGRLEQVYDERVGVVAGFFRAPPMNLVPARATTVDGRLHVSAQVLMFHCGPDRPRTRT